MNDNVWELRWVKTPDKKRRSINKIAQQKSSIIILIILWRCCAKQRNVRTTKPLTTPISGVFCWAILFIHRLRFPSRLSIAEVLKKPLIHTCKTRTIPCERNKALSYLYTITWIKMKGFWPKRPHFAMFLTVFRKLRFQSFLWSRCK